MPRIPELERADLPPAAQTVYDEILASRKNLAGPFRVWLHSPEFARRAAHLGDFVRYHTALSLRQSELVILTTGRLQKCPTEWAIHEPIARRAGLPGEIIDALAADRRPAFAEPLEEAIYDYCVELHRDRVVSRPTFERLLGLVGRAALVEITGICGYYTLVAMTLNAFEVEA